jgi:hypothetical protein
MYYSIAYNDKFASISDKKFCLRVYNRDHLEFLWGNQIFCIRFINLPTSLIVIKGFKTDFIRLANKLLNTVFIPELYDIARKIEAKPLFSYCYE